MKRHLTAEQYQAFARAVAEQSTASCFGCRLVPSERWKCHGRSGGAYDAHHLLSQSFLKREIGRDDPERLLAALTDPRNGVMVRRWHHDQLENHRIRPTLADLPDAVFAFADEYGLGWALDRYYGRAEAV